jgi:hypothetical protein
MPDLSPKRRADVEALSALFQPRPRHVSGDSALSRAMGADENGSSGHCGEVQRFAVRKSAASDPAIELRELRDIESPQPSLNLVSVCLSIGDSRPSG